MLYGSILFVKPVITHEGFCVKRDLTRNERPSYPHDALRLWVLMSRARNAAINIKREGLRVLKESV